MANITLEVPDIGEFSDVPVIDVYISEGDQIGLEDPVISLESAKAVMDIPSSHAGKVLEVLVKVGDKVSRGDKIAVLEAAEQQQEEEQPQQPEEKAPPEEPVKEIEKATPQKDIEAPEKKEVPVNRQESGAVYHAAPSVRQFARRVGVELSNVTGTGVKGRILTEDVEKHIKQVMDSGPASALSPIPDIDYSVFGEIEEHELSRIQKISGPHIHRSWSTIPHVTHYEEADVTDLESFRQELKEQGEKHSILSFVIPAVVKALQKFPDFNASLHSSGERVVRKRYYHIGIAVDTPQGLVVPVIRDADKLGIGELTHKLHELSSRAREGKLKPDDITGGSFTISSLGGIGGVGFTPIINAPEAAILGLSGIQKKPVWNDLKQGFIPRLVLPFSVSYDHRIIDGAMGARFSVFLASLLGDIRRVLL